MHCSCCSFAFRLEDACCGSFVDAARRQEQQEQQPEHTLQLYELAGPNGSGLRASLCAQLQLNIQNEVLSSHSVAFESYGCTKGGHAHSEVAVPLCSFVSSSVVLSLASPYAPPVVGRFVLSAVCCARPHVKIRRVKLPGQLEPRRWYWLCATQRRHRSDTDTLEVFFCPVSPGRGGAGTPGTAGGSGSMSRFRVSHSYPQQQPGTPSAHGTTRLVIGCSPAVEQAAPPSHDEAQARGEDADDDEDAEPLLDEEEEEPWDPFGHAAATPPTTSTAQWQVAAVAVHGGGLTQVRGVVSCCRSQYVWLPVRLAPSASGRRSALANRCCVA
jgi:hypothetical protein